MELTDAEQIFSRMCQDDEYASAVSRGDIDVEVSEAERNALIHDAGLILSETVGFTNQFRVEIDGISANWMKPISSRFHGSDFNSAVQSDARHPGD